MIVVIGDLMLDVVAAHEQPLAPGSDSAAKTQLLPGGAGGNVAGWLAHAGAPVALIARTGDDAFAAAATGGLDGVDLRIKRVAGETTGICVVLVDRDGERTMLPDAGANSALLPDDVAAADVASAAWVHVSGYTLLNPGSREAGCAALAAARRAGVRASVDVASAAPLQALGGKEFLRLTEGTDLVFCTVDEAEVLVGTRDPDLALARLTGSYGEVVLKLGALGARWSREGAADVSVGAATPSGPVVDTTGAGDAFCAAYLDTALSGGSSADALAAGCTAGAAAVVEVGARPISPGSPR